MRVAVVPAFSGAPVSVARATPARFKMSARAQAEADVDLAAAAESGEVIIRRRPPRGIATQGCGPMDFQVPVDEDNTPRNILEEIIWFKGTEVARWREKTPLGRVAMMAKQADPARDFRGALLAKLAETKRPGLIAEVKKASPSKGVIQPNFDAVKIAQGYEAGGAACLSVLTDTKYFQGSFENLRNIRAAGVSCPLLCKEFIVDAYQVMKARAFGADAILLIAAVLTNSDMEYMIKTAGTVGLQCLVEVHSEGELRRVLAVPGIDAHVVGINNRNLTTFEIDIGVTKRILESELGQEALARGIPMVGESAIFTPADVKFVLDAGCSAILVGESIVKQDDFETAVKTLLA